jgi:hypothetical protein
MHNPYRNSDARGYRWFYAFIGALIIAVALYALVDGISQIKSEDLPILIFPILLLVCGVGMLYVGIFMSDKKVMLITEFLKSLGMRT